MIDLAGKTVLITGASKGIGAALAQAYAQKGCNLLLQGRDEAALQQVQAQAKQYGADARILLVDLLDDAAPATIIRACEDSFGALDVLINNAGVMEPSRVETTTTESFDRHMKINVYAPFFLSQQALPLLRRSSVKLVFNLCSIVSIKAYENQSIYSISKHAMYGLTKVFSREHHADGIRAIAVLPGLVSTELAVTARPEIPLSDMTAPEDIAAWFVFMTEHKNSAIVDELIVRRPGKKAFE